MSDAFLWLSLNILSIVVLSFYTSVELAVVSFSKVRLQYYVAQGDKRAIRLNWLLANSARLFGTTLIGVNVAMMFGSEFARQFHKAIGLSPDLAPLSQVIIVIIFGELAPIFAARRFAEHFSMLGANFLYASAILMKPLLWIIGLITHAVHFFFGGKSESFDLYLNQEEIRNILEEHHEEQPAMGSVEELNAIVSNIFDLRSKTALKIMQPLNAAIKIPSNSPIRKMRQLLLNTTQNFLLVYHRGEDNIVGIAHPRDLIREADNRRVGDHCRQPWFIASDTEVVHILHQFRSNKRTVAVVIDNTGKAIGFLTLQDVLDEIFVHGGASLSQEASGPPPIIERTFPGSMKVSEFNELFGVNLESLENETLSELMTRTIGHHPEVGETVSIAPFELQVKEATLLEVKLITIKTRVI
jgi:putative hemolysin